ncbi:uncharacterized protein LOC128221874 isoform X1 [Mya arenaria]|uniref:uncharacterized protein LOC128221874 isoform X1 n=1 Tax=Mya arenaria TaxID=6604 RepID=UPI0022DF1CC1|nr:uncharacterized protein LOC128221874 isoform X1 [Mya arenaria]
MATNFLFAVIHVVKTACGLHNTPEHREFKLITPNMTFEDVEIMFLCEPGSISEIDMSTSDNGPWTRLYEKQLYDIPVVQFIGKFSAFLCIRVRCVTNNNKTGTDTPPDCSDAGTSKTGDKNVFEMQAERTAPPSRPKKQTTRMEGDKGQGVFRCKMMFDDLDTRRSDTRDEPDLKAMGVATLSMPDASVVKPVLDHTSQPVVVEAVDSHGSGPSVSLSGRTEKIKAENDGKKEPHQTKCKCVAKFEKEMICQNMFLYEEVEEHVMRTEPFNKKSREEGEDPAQVQPSEAGGYTTPVQPSEAGGYPAQVQPSEAGGYPAPVQPSEAGGYPAPVQPSEAGGYPTQNQPSEGGGFPAPVQPSEAGGYPAPVQPSEAGGYPAPVQPSEAGGYPAPVQPSEADGYPAPVQPSEAGGYPAQVQPSEASVYPAQVQPSEAGGYPAPVQPSDAGGYPAQFQPSEASVYPAQVQPSEAGGYPAQVQPSEAGGYPAQVQPSEAGGYPAQVQPSEAGGYPTQNQPSEAGGFPAPVQPSEAGGYPAQVQPSKAGGYPAQVQPSEAGGYPAPVQPSEADGYPAPVQPSEAGGYPAQVQPSEASVYPAQVQPSEAGGYPAPVQPSEAGGYPAQVQPSEASVYPAQVQPSKAGGYPAQVQPSEAGGYPAQVQPSEAGGYPAQVQLSEAGGYPNQVQPSEAGGYPNQVQLSEAGEYPAQVQPSEAGGYPAQVQPSEAGGYPAQVQPSEAGEYPAQVQLSEADKDPNQVQPSEADEDPALVGGKPDSTSYFNKVLVFIGFILVCFLAYVAAVKGSNYNLLLKTSAPSDTQPLIDHFHMENIIRNGCSREHQSAHNSSNKENPRASPPMQRNDKGKEGHTQEKKGHELEKEKNWSILGWLVGFFVLLPLGSVITCLFFKKDFCNVRRRILKDNPKPHAGKSQDEEHELMERNPGSNESPGPGQDNGIFGCVKKLLKAVYKVLIAVFMLINEVYKVLKEMKSVIAVIDFYNQAVKFFWEQAKGLELQDKRLPVWPIAVIGIVIGAILIPVIVYAVCKFFKKKASPPAPLNDEQARVPLTTPSKTFSETNGSVVSNGNTHSVIDVISDGNAHGEVEVVSNGTAHSAFVEERSADSDNAET